MKIFSLLTLATSAAALAVTPVGAAGPAAGIAIVSTADLDLSNVRDQRVLDQRLTNAIVEACGEASNFDIEGRNDVRACRVEARAKVNASRDRLVQLAQRGGGVTLAAR